MATGDTSINDNTPTAFGTVGAYINQGIETAEKVGQVVANIRGLNNPNTTPAPSRSPTSYQIIGVTVLVALIAIITYVLIKEG